MHLEFTYTPDDVVQAAKLAATLPKSPNGRRFGRSVFAWTLFIVLAALLFLMLNNNDNSSNRSPTATGSPTTQPAPMTRQDFVNKIVLPFAPWVVIFFVIWIFVFRQLRRSSAKALADNPQLHQVQLLDVDADGVRLETPLASTHWKWPSFSRLTETTDLLLLHLPERSFVVIPKRALASPEQLAELHQIIGENLRERTGAFPVLPASTGRSSDQRGI